jgi:hypothetical protein
VSWAPSSVLWRDSSRTWSGRAEVQGVSAGENGFGVQVLESTDGWRVSILDPEGAVVGERACSDHLEARTYASTVRQHMYWLSAEKFREYYRV